MDAYHASNIGTTLPHTLTMSNDSPLDVVRSNLLDLNIRRSGESTPLSSSPQTPRTSKRCLLSSFENIKTDGSSAQSSSSSSCSTSCSPTPTTSVLNRVRISRSNSCISELPALYSRRSALPFTLPVVKPTSAINNIGKENQTNAPTTVPTLPFKLDSPSSRVHRRRSPRPLSSDKQSTTILPVTRTRTSSCADLLVPRPPNASMNLPLLPIIPLASITIRTSASDGFNSSESTRSTSSSSSMESDEMDTEVHTQEVEEGERSRIHRITEGTPLSLSTSNLPSIFSDEERTCTILTHHKSGKSPDLVLISPQTMNDFVNGNYSNKYDLCYIIDCRFEYEYKGGHIKNAVNMSSKEMVEQHFVRNLLNLRGKKVVLVFYCEFSSLRGPTCYRHLRTVDRRNNVNNYPYIDYPECYVLDGGYSAFFNQFKNSCEPQAYIKMHDAAYDEQKKKELKDNSTWTRSKSRSFAGFTAFQECRINTSHSSDQVSASVNANTTNAIRIGSNNN